MTYKSSMGQAEMIPDPWTQRVLAQERQGAMGYTRAMGQVTADQVAPWLNLATQTAGQIAQAVRNADGSVSQLPYGSQIPYYPPTPPPEPPSMLTPVLVGGGLLLLLGFGYVALQKKTMKANGRRSRRRR